MELDKLKEIVAGVMHIDPKTITEETEFLEDLGADSLEIYEMVIEIEEAFQIEVSFSSINKAVTVGEAYALLMQAAEGIG